MGMTHLLAGAYRPKTGRCCSPHSSIERKDRYATLTIHYLILKMKESIPSEWPLDWCVRYSFNLVSSQKAKFGLGNCRVQVPWQSHSLIKFLISDTSLIILLKHEFLWKVVFFKSPFSVFFFYFFYYNLFTFKCKPWKTNVTLSEVAVQFGWRVTFT